MKPKIVRQTEGHYPNEYVEQNKENKRKEYQEISFWNNNLICPSTPSQNFHRFVLKCLNLTLIKIKIK